MSDKNKTVGKAIKVKRNILGVQESGAKYNREFVEEKGVRITNYPDITTRKRFAYNKKLNDHELKFGKAPNSKVLESIIDDTPHNISFDISKGVTNATPYKNPAQYTIESLDMLAATTNQPQPIFALDTEWAMVKGKNVPIEFGIAGGSVQGSKMTINSTAQTIAVQLDENSAEQVKSLVDKIMAHKNNKTSTSLVLSKSEYITASQLMNYTDDAFDAGGRVKARGRKAILNRANILDYADDILAGFENLDPNNTGAKALARNKLASNVTEIMMQGGWNPENDPFFVGQNFIDSDIKAWRGSYGASGIASEEDVFKLMKRGRFVDTLSIARTKDPTLLRRQVKKGKGTATLSRQVDLFAGGYKFKAHVAGEDALANLHVLKGMLENPLKGSTSPYIKELTDSAYINNIYTPGANLFSVGAMRRESPLDMVVRKGKKGYEAMDFMDIANSKNAVFEFQKQFIYNYGGKEYYGVVMHNKTDDVYTTVARESYWDLQALIQQNFKPGKDIVNKKAVQKYRLEDYGRKAYRSMFSGVDSPYKFEKYMSMLDDFNTIKTRTKGRLMSKAERQALLNKYTPAQVRDFESMLPRLKSEEAILQTFRKDVLSQFPDKAGTKHKIVALDQLGNLLRDPNLAPGAVENVTLPGEVFQQGRIFDPVSKQWKTIDLASDTSAANSIRRILGSNGRDPRMGLADSIVQARHMVNDLAAKGIIDETKAARIMNDINKLQPGRDYTGVQDLSAVIAMEAREGILEFNKQHGFMNLVEDQESLKARKINKTSSRLVTQQFDDIARTAQDFFSVDGNLSKVSKEVGDKIHKYDEFLRNYVVQVSGNAAAGNDLAPRGMLDLIQNMTSNYSYNQVAADVTFASKNGSHGLMMSLADRNTATGVVMQKGKKTANIFIPLVDLKTGAIRSAGTDGINLLNLVNDGNGVRVETYQHKVMDALGDSKLAYRVSDLLKDGRIDEAESLAQRVITRSLSGRPGASVHRISDHAGELAFNTVHANWGKKHTVDLNDLIKKHAGVDSIDKLSDELMSVHKMDMSDLIRQILYDDEVAEGTSGGVGRNHIATAVRRDLNTAFGENKWNVMNVKGEKAQGLFVGLKKGEYRRLGVFGDYADLGRENYRSAQNYYKLGMDDVIQPDGKTRRSVLSKFDKRIQNRLTDRLAVTEDYLDVLNKSPGQVAADPTFLNVKTAFVSESDLARITKDGKPPHWFKALTVHDDTMVLRDDVAEAFGSFENRTVRLGAEIDLNPEIKKALDQNRLRDSSRRVTDIIGATPDGEVAKTFGDYGLRHDSIIQSVDFVDGEWQMAVKEFRPSHEAMKMQGYHGGNKYTVRIMTTQDIVDSAGEAYRNVEAFAMLKHDKMSGDFLTSQVNTMMTEVNERITVGKMTVAQGQAKAIEIIEGGFRDGGASQKQIEAITDQIRFEEITEAGRVRGLTAVMPSEMNAPIMTRGLFDRVNKFTGGKNLIDGTMTGIFSIARMNVADEVKTFGSTLRAGEGVKVTMRELEQIHARKYILKDTNIDEIVSGITDGFQGQFDDNRLHGQGLFEVITQHIEDRDRSQFPMVHTRTPGDLDFDDFSPVPRIANRTMEDLRDTLMNPDQFGGKPYYLELPETFNVGGQELNKILLAPRELQEVDGVVQFDKLQGYQRQIVDYVEKYKKSLVYDDTNLLTEKERNAAAAQASKMRDEARTGLQHSLDNYVEQAGIDFQGSKGYFHKNAMTKRMPHSGRFHFSAVSPDIGEHLASNLEEGSGLISRKHLRAMLGGLDDVEIEKALAMAETEGIMGVGVRYPSFQTGSVQPVKMRVLSEKLEDELPTLMNSDSIYVTVGTQKRWQADFDGDHISYFMPQYGGAKAGEINEGMQRQMQNWFAEENKWNTKIASQTKINMRKEAENLYEKMMSSTASMPYLSDDPVNAVRMVESRLQKEVGIFSNLNTSYRRMAEQAAGHTGDESLVGIMSFYGSTWEQLPISAKKLGDKIPADAGIDALAEYIRNPAEMKRGILSFDVEKMLEVSDRMGVFDENGVFVGVGHMEGERYFQKFNKYLTRDDVENALNQIKSATVTGNPRDAVMKGQINLGLRNVDSAEEAFKAGESYLSGNRANSFINNFFGFELTMGRALGLTDVVEGADEAAQAMYDVNMTMMRNQRATRSFEKAFESINPVGDAMEGIAKKASAMGPQIGIGAAALGGAVLIGSMFGGPSTKRNVEQGQPDQAPSSDGTYINRAMFQGAPPGAAPTARVQQKDMYEQVNINVSGTAMRNMSNEQMAELVSSEVQMQTGNAMKININSQDDRKSLNAQWVQDKMRGMMRRGFAY